MNSWTRSSEPCFRKAKGVIDGRYQLLVELNHKNEWYHGVRSGEGHCSPLHYSCLENPMDRGAWGATVHGGGRSGTLLRQLTLHSYRQGVCYKEEGFPSGSHGKESACKAGDPGSIPASGRSPGGGNGYPLQCSCLEDSMDRGAWWATVHGVAERQTRLSY